MKELICIIPAETTITCTADLSPLKESTGHGHALVGRVGSNPYQKEFFNSETHRKIRQLIRDQNYPG